MEEYTGTWCGWCPRGIVGLQLVNETYGDRVQTIAVHYDDPMETSVYYSLLPGSFPNATVNRGEDTGIADEALNDKGQTRDGKWYNLNGQRLSTPPAKGMYIHMGKKVMRAGR
jgi:thiol-disulfide isomerase/thioredoxin